MIVPAMRNAKKDYHRNALYHKHLELPINLFVAYPVAVPVVHAHAGRADEEVPGVLGESEPPKPHELPQGTLVPYPRVEVKYLYVPPDPLGRHELKLPLAGLGCLRALLPEPRAYSPAIAAESAATLRPRAAVLQEER